MSAWNVGDPGSIPGSGRSPEEGKWHPTPVLLPRESHAQRSLVGYIHGVAKSRTRLSDFTHFTSQYAITCSMTKESHCLGSSDRTSTTRRAELKGV